MAQDAARALSTCVWKHLIDPLLLGLFREQWPRPGLHQPPKGNLLKTVDPASPAVVALNIIEPFPGDSGPLL